MRVRNAQTCVKKRTVPHKRNETRIIVPTSKKQTFHMSKAEGEERPTIAAKERGKDVQFIFHMDGVEK